MNKHIKGMLANGNIIEEMIEEGDPIHPTFFLLVILFNILLSPITIPLYFLGGLLFRICSKYVKTNKGE